ncbi:glycosyltransferase family 87 protein [Streptomyces cyanogenus]|uniref:Polyprenol-phosphate-mannose-dependent alpha-(1-2)-phosphatidylinositol mannoside mannosyltransferase n=1 Tax=Streptomyces cyanogenus TaxID=80860 RepID=A0ABX7TJC0_STRCY|nr:Polyprenol-phosphate-mannose-dependent alpha-(1-2)-phosphatidylinositol mannoside mannosyltransferase [Streptomyces cyanogenus]
MSAPPRPRTERGRLLAVLVLAVAVTAFTATVPLLRDFFDLRVYYGTVHTWVHHGGRIYDYRVPGTSYGFTYPPFAAVAMLPLALLGRTTAIAASLLVNLAALAVVLLILAGPDRRRHGWYRWALCLCLLALFEPLRDTVSFGQVNTVLLALVLADCRLLATGRGRWAGVGIGLAAAVKLTPALFVVLLLLAGRRRAAATATAVAAAATALAVWADPAASRFYWTGALWDTGRVGRLDYVSNQSLQGVLARLGETGRPLWAAVVLLTLGVWVWRSRRAVAAGDWTAAFALTGAAACLVSPITWVHHLVWLLPSFAVLLRAGHPRTAGALYAVLCTSVVWLWADDASGPGGFLGGNAYTWISLGLLLGLPTGQSRADRPPLARSARATAPAPSPLRPATTAVPDQSEPSSSGVTAAATGFADAGVRDGGRSPSSEPTGSTCPAAAKPQSSRARASSYTVNPPPA